MGPMKENLQARKILVRASESHPPAHGRTLGMKDEPRSPKVRPVVRDPLAPRMMLAGEEAMAKARSQFLSSKRVGSLIGGLLMSPRKSGKSFRELGRTHYSNYGRQTIPINAIY